MKLFNSGKFLDDTTRKGGRGNIGRNVKVRQSVVAGNQTKLGSLGINPSLQTYMCDISFSFVLVSIIGWVIYLVFFTLLDANDGRVAIFYLPHWVFLFMGIVLHVIVVLHLLLEHRFIAVITHVCSIVYLVAGGAIMYTDLAVFYPKNYEGLYIFEFLASTISVTFIALSILLWHCFPTRVSEVEGSVALQAISMAPLGLTPPVNTSSTAKTMSATDRQDSAKGSGYEAVVFDIGSNPDNPQYPNRTFDDGTDDQSLYEDVGSAEEDNPSDDYTPMDVDAGEEEYVVSQLVYDEPQVFADTDDAQGDQYGDVLM